jgi:hypothetical protein
VLLERQEHDFLLHSAVLHIHDLVGRRGFFVPDNIRLVNILPVSSSLRKEASDNDHKHRLLLLLDLILLHPLSRKVVFNNHNRNCPLLDLRVHLFILHQQNNEYPARDQEEND